MNKTRILFIMCMLLLLPFIGCGKGVDLDKIDDSYVVVTQRDTAFNFAHKPTYYIENRIYLYDDVNTADNKEWHYDTSFRAQLMLDEIDQQLQARGYQKSPQLDEGVDLSMAVVYFIRVKEDITREWWTIWNQWHNNWTLGYLPTSSMKYYAYEIGTFEIIMLDHQAKPTPASTDSVVVKPLVWLASAVGLPDLDNDFKEDRVCRAISQAFEQSPYITPKTAEVHE